MLNINEPTNAPGTVGARIFETRGTRGDCAEPPEQDDWQDLGEYFHAHWLS